MRENAAENGYVNRVSKNRTNTKDMDTKPRTSCCQNCCPFCSDKRTPYKTCCDNCCESEPGKTVSLESISLEEPTTGMYIKTKTRSDNVAHNYVTKKVIKCGKCDEGPKKYMSHHQSPEQSGKRRKKKKGNKQVNKKGKQQGAEEYKNLYEDSREVIRKKYFQLFKGVEEHKRSIQTTEPQATEVKTDNLKRKMNTNPSKNDQDNDKTHKQLRNSKHYIVCNDNTCGANCGCVNNCRGPRMSTASKHPDPSMHKKLPESDSKHFGRTCFNNVKVNDKTRRSFDDRNNPHEHECPCLNEIARNRYEDTSTKKYQRNSKSERRDKHENCDYDHRNYTTPEDENDFYQRTSLEKNGKSHKTNNERSNTCRHRNSHDDKRDDINYSDNIECKCNEKNQDYENGTQLFEQIQRNSTALANRIRSRINSGNHEDRNHSLQKTGNHGRQSKRESYSGPKTFVDIRRTTENEDVLNQYRRQSNDVKGRDCCNNEDHNSFTENHQRHSKRESNWSGRKTIEDLLRQTGHEDPCIRFKRQCKNVEGHDCCNYEDHKDSQKVMENHGRQSKQERYSGRKTIEDLRRQPDNEDACSRFKHQYNNVEDCKYNLKEQITLERPCTTGATKNDINLLEDVDRRIRQYHNDRDKLINESDKNDRKKNDYRNDSQTDKEFKTYKLKESKTYDVINYNGKDDKDDKSGKCKRANDKCSIFIPSRMNRNSINDKNCREKVVKKLDFETHDIDECPDNDFARTKSSTCTDTYIDDIDVAYEQLRRKYELRVANKCENSKSKNNNNTRNNGNDVSDMHSKWREIFNKTPTKNLDSSEYKDKQHKYYRNSSNIEKSNKRCELDANEEVEDSEEGEDSFNSDCEEDDDVEDSETTDEDDDDDYENSDEVSYECCETSDEDDLLDDIDHNCHNRSDQIQVIKGFSSRQMPKFDNDSLTDVTSQDHAAVKKPDQSIYAKYLAELRKKDRNNKVYCKDNDLEKFDAIEDSQPTTTENKTNFCIFCTNKERTLVLDNVRTEVKNHSQKRSGRTCSFLLTTKPNDTVSFSPDKIHKGRSFLNNISDQQEKKRLKPELPVVHEKTKNRSKDTKTCSFVNGDSKKKNSNKPSQNVDSYALRQQKMRPVYSSWAKPKVK